MGCMLNSIKICEIGLLSLHTKNVYEIAIYFFFSKCRIVEVFFLIQLDFIGNIRGNIIAIHLQREMSLCFYCVIIVIIGLLRFIREIKTARNFSSSKKNNPIRELNKSILIHKICLVSAE